MRFARISNPEVFRVVTRAHLIAWRKELEGRGCEGSTIRRKLSAVSSLFEYLCERNAVVHNPVKGVKRPKVTNANEGLTPALSDEQARMLLEAPPADTLKGKRDRAILATLLYHGLRREELCKLRVRDLQQREGVLHFRVHGKGDKVRYIPVGLKAQRLITEYLEEAKAQRGSGRRTVSASEEQYHQDARKTPASRVGVPGDCQALRRHGGHQCRCARLLRACACVRPPRPMRSRIMRTLPKCRSGWGMPTLPPRGFMIAGRAGRRRVRHLKWSINRLH